MKQGISDSDHAALIAGAYKFSRPSTPMTENEKLTEEITDAVLMRSTRPVTGLIDNTEMGALAMTDASCGHCGGQGWTEGVRPACCGNLTPSGSCRGSCCVPEQFQEQCGNCNGTGYVVVTVYLREVDAGTDNACWVVCAKGDPGAILFTSK